MCTNGESHQLERNLELFHMALRDPRVLEFLVDLFGTTQENHLLPQVPEIDIRQHHRSLDRLLVRRRNYKGAFFSVVAEQDVSHCFPELLMGVRTLGEFLEFLWYLKGGCLEGILLEMLSTVDRAEFVNGEDVHTTLLHLSGVHELQTSKLPSELGYFGRVPSRAFFFGVGGKSLDGVAFLEGGGRRGWASRGTSSGALVLERRQSAVSQLHLPRRLPVVIKRYEASRPIWGEGGDLGLIIASVGEPNLYIHVFGSF